MPERQWPRVVGTWESRRRSPLPSSSPPPSLQFQPRSEGLSSEPGVLGAANPTRGLDVGATESVRTLLIEAAARGVGILLISEDLDEILVLADRIAVIFEGRIVGVVSRAGADVQHIGLMMAGAS